MRVAMGGTFDVLHDGHDALLGAAFGLRPDVVLIGLTTDRLARETRDEVHPSEVRRRNLRRRLEGKGWRPARIEPIDDPFGPADDLADLDVIVVSAERHRVAIGLNEARKGKGLRPLEIHTVPMLLAQDGLPIASRRIRAGVIDRHGTRVKALDVRVGTDNPVKRRAVRKVLERLGWKARVRAADVGRDVPEEPFEGDVARGAVARAKAALGEGDLGVGIEAGLRWDDAADDYLDVQYCAVVDRAGRLTLGHGPGFAHPPAVLRRVKAGATVGEAMAAITGVKRLGSRHGAIGYLTARAMDRDALTEAAVLMAMVPRIRRELYPAGNPETGR